MINKKQSSYFTISILAIFSIAMGFMESAVVVYLRKVYYPFGFEFPLKSIDDSILLVEILREAATLIMLLTIGILTGRTRTERFGFFIFCFAIWDIFYYVFLYFLVGWPESLLTWDILFLIPVTWVGPVLGPLINSVTMIILALLIHYFTSINEKTRIKIGEWCLLILGSIINIISYTEDYIHYITRKFAFIDLFKPSENKKLMDYAELYIPVSFSWWIFIIGEVLILLAIFIFYKRNRNHKKSPTTAGPKF